MRASRIAPALLLLALAGAAVVWAIWEGRRQQQETAAALAAEATVLAKTLGPSLAAASASMRELDESQTRRLLDNARLLAQLQSLGKLSPARADYFVELHDLDSVVYVPVTGSPRFLAGPAVPEEVIAEVLDVARGTVDETILENSAERGVEHLAVAAHVPGGGALLVRIHVSAALSAVRSIGLENLLQGLVGEGGVLYLEYAESPSGRVYSASWDGGSLPAARPSDHEALTVRGRPVFEVDLPVKAPAGSSATLRVGLDGGPLKQASASALRRTILVGLVLAALSLSIVGLGFIARLRSIERQQAERRLAEAEKRRLRSERLAAAGTLTAGLAHEVRSPLNAIGLAAQRIRRRGEETAECAEFAEGIQKEVRRLEGVLRDFLEMASPISSRRENTDFSRLLREVFDLLALEAEEKQVHLGPVTGEASANVDKEAVRRCLINLLRNAIEISPPRGEVQARLLVEDGEAVMEILDEGPGIDLELAPRVFDAFFTTRAAGTGLGLSLVKRVMDEHQGRCSLHSREGTQGAVAELRFPLGAAAGDSDDS